MCNSLFVITAGLNVLWWPELDTILRFKCLGWKVMFFFIKRRSPKLALGMVGEPWDLISKDRLRAVWHKIRTHNNRRNNNFMIFQRSKLKLINHSPEISVWNGKLLGFDVSTDRHWLALAGRLESHDRESQKCSLSVYPLALLATGNKCLFPFFEVFFY